MTTMARVWHYSYSQRADNRLIRGARVANPVDGSGNEYRRLQRYGPIDTVSYCNDHNHDQSETGNYVP